MVGVTDGAPGWERRRGQEAAEVGGPDRAPGAGVHVTPRHRGRRRQKMSLMGRSIGCRDGLVKPTVQSPAGITVAMVSARTWLKSAW